MKFKTIFLIAIIACIIVANSTEEENVEIWKVKTPARKELNCDDANMTVPQQYICKAQYYDIRNKVFNKMLLKNAMSLTDFQKKKQASMIDEQFTELAKVEKLLVLQRVKLRKTLAELDQLWMKYFGSHRTFNFNSNDNLVKKQKQMSCRACPQAYEDCLSTDDAISCYSDDIEFYQEVKVGLEDKYHLQFENLMELKQDEHSMNSKNILISPDDKLSLLDLDIDLRKVENNILWLLVWDEKNFQIRDDVMSSMESTVAFPLYGLESFDEAAEVNYTYWKLKKRIQNKSWYNAVTK